MGKEFIMYYIIIMAWTPEVSQENPQQNLEWAIKLYQELSEASKKAGKEAEFLKLSIKLKLSKEVLDSVNDDLKELHNRVVDKTQDNNPKIGATITKSTTWDPTDVKFDINEWNNVRKTTRVAGKAARKYDRINDRITNKTWLNGIDGLIAAVNQLASEVRQNSPEIYGTRAYEQSKQYAEKMLKEWWLTDPTEIKKLYEAEIKAWKSPQSAAMTITKDLNKKATDLLVDKANFDPGIAQATVIWLAIWWALKAYPAIRGVFPDGIWGFLLMWLTAYTAAKNIPRDKALDMYQSVFGNLPGGVEDITSKPELAYLKLESNDFKNWQMLFAWLRQHLKDPTNTELFTTYLKTNDQWLITFDVKQMTNDYESWVVWYTWINKPVNTKVRELFKISKESDMFMGVLSARANSLNGDMILNQEVSAFLKWISTLNYKSDGKPSYTSSDEIFKQLWIYQAVNMKRYEILKKAGFEISKDALSHEKDKRLDIDAITSTFKLQNDWKVSIEDIKKLQPFIDDLIIVPTIDTSNLDINIDDSKTIDRLLTKNLISLQNNEKSTINRFKLAFAREDAKYVGDMKFSMMEVGSDQESIPQICIDIQWIWQFPVVIDSTWMSLWFRNTANSNCIPKAIRGMEFHDEKKFFDAIGIMITQIMPMRYQSNTSLVESKKSWQSTLDYFSSASRRWLTFRKDHWITESSYLDNTLISQAKLKELFPQPESQTTFIDWLNTSFMIDELPIRDRQAKEISYFYSGWMTPNTSILRADRDLTAGQEIKNSLQDGVNYALDIGRILWTWAKTWIIEALEWTWSVGKKIVEEMGNVLGEWLSQITQLIPQGFSAINSVVWELWKTFEKMSDTELNWFMGWLWRLLKSGVIQAWATWEQIMAELWWVTGQWMDQIKKVFNEHWLLNKWWLSAALHLGLGIIAYRFTKYWIKQSAWE